MQGIYAIIINICQCVASPAIGGVYPGYGVELPAAVAPPEPAASVVELSAAESVMCGAKG